MTKYFEDDYDYNEKPFQVHIGDKEWANFSFENKVRLLYRLRNCKSTLSKEIEKTVSQLVEEEQKEREIDYEATLRKAEEDVTTWQE